MKKATERVIMVLGLIGLAIGMVAFGHWIIYPPMSPEMKSLTQLEAAMAATKAESMGNTEKIMRLREHIQITNVVEDASADEQRLLIHQIACTDLATTLTEQNKQDAYYTCSIHQSDDGTFAPIRHDL